MSTKDIPTKIAEALLAKWLVGRYERPPTFTPTSVEEIAAEIRGVLMPMCLGFKLEVSHDVPDNEIHVVQDGKVLHCFRITA